MMKTQLFVYFSLGQEFINLVNIYLFLLKQHNAAAAPLLFSTHNICTHIPHGNASDFILFIQLLREYNHKIKYTKCSKAYKIKRIRTPFSILYAFDIQ